MVDCKGTKIYHGSKVRFIDDDMGLDFVGRLYRTFISDGLVLALDIPNSNTKLVFEDDGTPCFQLTRI